MRPLPDSGPIVPAPRSDLVTPPHSPDPVPLSPALTPRGHLLLAPDEGAPGVPREIALRLTEAFARGHGEGLLQLGAGEIGTPLPPALTYWRDFAAQYVTALCARPGGDATDAAVRPRKAAPAGLGVAAPEPAELERLRAAVPPMLGAEYLTADVLDGLWQALDTAVAARLAASGESVEQLLRGFSDAWHTVGRVHFHLAENRGIPTRRSRSSPPSRTRCRAARRRSTCRSARPFASTPTAAGRPRLLSLLVPVQRAAERCAWLKRMVDASEIFHPLRWSPQEAITFLRDVPLLEQSGVVVRVPAAWRHGRPPRPRVTATVGTKAPSGLGLDTLLDFHVAVTLGGDELTPDEIDDILRKSDGLVLLRGQWVEVDRTQLTQVLDRFEAVHRAAAEAGLSFGEAMRLLAGTDGPAGPAPDEAERTWAGVVAGPWLAQTLQHLRGPEALDRVDPGEDLRGHLRPYQQVGVRWLHLLSSLGLGACLADDMGLGKTIQVLALLLVLKRARGSAAPRPSLLVAPASLLANWVAEAERFAPGLRTLVAHPSAMPAADLKAIDAAVLARADLVITTYGAVRTLDWVARASWDLVVADEAQAIKNPAARQTRAVKSLTARVRARADRHADREPAERPVVDLRLRQPGPAGLGHHLHGADQAPGQPAAQRLRPAARSRASVHPATAQDRSLGDRGPAGEDRGQRVLPAGAPAGGPLRAHRRRASRPVAPRPTAWRAAASCWRRSRG